MPLLISKAVTISDFHYTIIVANGFIITILL